MGREAGQVDLESAADENRGLKWLDFGRCCSIFLQL